MATKIIGIDNMPVEQINHELQNGAKFVMFEYCFSIILMTFKQPTNIYFVKKSESTAGKSIGYTLVSVLFGWWGIPWGPIYTIAALVTNLKGGKDVTAEVIASFNQAADSEQVAEGAPSA